MQLYSDLVRKNDQLQKNNKKYTYLSKSTTKEYYGDQENDTYLTTTNFKKYFW